MATPPRELILDNVQTTLEGITTANGYKSDVETVERVLKTWHDVGGGYRTWVGYMPQVQQITHQPFGYMRVLMPLYVLAHMKASTKAEVQEMITNLEDDIIAALMADTTRGGNATQTTITSQQDDIGDPDSVDSIGAGGSLVVQANILYFRGVTSS